MTDPQSKVVARRASGYRWALPAAAALVFFLGLAFDIRVAVLNSSGWGVDFNQFYSAGKLTGTGHLYDWEALRKIEAEHGPGVPTGRLPVVLYGHKLLGILPYRVAQTAWMGLSITALVVFAFTWPGAWPPLMALALAWSMPVTMLILFGQDTAFWLMFFAAGLALIERKKPRAAGVAFSLCICKFHLALGIPILLVAQKRWKTLIAGSISLLVLLASCFLVEGTRWPLEYLKMSQMTEFSPAPDVMPTLSAIASHLPWPAAIEILCAIAVVLFLVVVCRRTADIGVAGAAAAACGLLVAHHALYADTSLLIPLGVLTVRHPGVPPWLKALAVLILSPLPFLLAGALHNSLIWQLLIAPFVVTAIWVTVAHSSVSAEPARVVG
jgi:hypothetical protein